LDPAPRGRVPTSRSGTCYDLTLMRVYEMIFVILLTGVSIIRTATIGFPHPLLGNIYHISCMTPSSIQDCFHELKWFLFLFSFLPKKPPSFYENIPGGPSHSEYVV